MFITRRRIVQVSKRKLTTNLVLQLKCIVRKHTVQKRCSTVDQLLRLNSILLQHIVSRHALQQACSATVTYNWANLLLENRDYIRRRVVVNRERHWWVTWYFGSVVQREKCKIQNTKAMHTSKTETRDAFQNCYFLSVSVDVIFARSNHGT